MENSAPDLSSCPPGYLPATAISKVQRIHRLFLKALEARLGDSLQGAAATALFDARQSDLAECLATVENELFPIALDIAPHPGHAVLSFPIALLRAVLDILLAKPSGAPVAPTAHITEIEIHILRDFFEAFTGTLRKAWVPTFPVAFNRLSTGVEDARQMLNTSSRIPVLVLTSRLKLAGADYSFNLILPGFLIRLAEVRGVPSQSPDRSSPSMEAVVNGPLGSAVVELEAVLRGATLRMGDLLALKPDQVLFLGAPIETRFDCLVNGKAQFSGEMVAGANRHCFQVQNING